jgi:hypothetical protein
MKVKHAIILVMLFSGTANSQTTFEFHLKRPYHEIARDLMEDQDGNVYFPVENFEFATIIKLDSTGNITDSIHIENPAGECSIGVLVPIDSSQIIALGSWSGDSTAFLWYLLLDQDLNILVEKMIHSENRIVHNFNYVLNHNGYLVFLAHHFQNNEVSFEDICFYEMTLDGIVLQDTFYSRPPTGNTGYMILENGWDSTYIVSTYSPLNTTTRTGYVHHLDTSFNVIEFYGLIADYVTFPNSAKWQTDSVYIYTGRKFTGVGNDRDVGILRVSIDDSVLNYQYTGKLDTLEFPGIYRSLDFLTSENIFFGYTTNTEYFPFQYFPSWIALSIFDSTLNLKDELFYGGDAYYLVNSILATQDSGCVMACTRFDYLAGSDVWDVYILKVNKDGLLVNLSEKEYRDRDNCQVYPNPGIDKLMIIAPARNSIFQLFDLSGRLLLQKKLNQGKNHISVQKLLSGYYSYRIIDNHGRIQSGKWIKK